MSKSKKKNFIEEFKSYMDETSEEQFKKDWSKTEKYAKVGPTMDKFSEKPPKNKINKQNNKN